LVPRTKKRKGSVSFELDLVSLDVVLYHTREEDSAKSASWKEVQEDEGEGEVSRFGRGKRGGREEKRRGTNKRNSCQRVLID
jgi:hypothetical protein